MSDPREYLKLKYMGDCKCGNCQLVPTEMLAQWAAEIERLKAALMPFAYETLPHTRRTLVDYDRNGLRRAMSPMEVAHRDAWRALTSTNLQPAEPEPHRWPCKGDKMRFLGENGYPLELEEAKKIFTVGNEYTVHDCDVQSWSHDIQFVGVKGRFNGVMFELSPHDRQEG